MVLTSDQPVVWASLPPPHYFYLQSFPFILASYRIGRKLSFNHLAYYSHPRGKAKKEWKFFLPVVWGN